jgi:hypothetical protein
MNTKSHRYKIKLSDDIIETLTLIKFLHTIILILYILHKHVVLTYVYVGHAYENRLPI